MGEVESLETQLAKSQVSMKVEQAQPRQARAFEQLSLEELSFHHRELVRAHFAAIGLEFPVERAAVITLTDQSDGLILKDRSYLFQVGQFSQPARGRFYSDSTEGGRFTGEARSTAPHERLVDIMKGRLPERFGVKRGLTICSRATGPWHLK